MGPVRASTSHFWVNNFSMIKDADMSTVMLMEWAGMTQEQYEQVLRNLDLDKNPPVGIFHVAGFTAGTIPVLDVWESQQAFEKFQKDRLAAAVQKAGITSQPKVQFYAAHNIYVPNLELIRKVRSTSVPSAA